ncbi:MAG TPA: aminotransferase class I/II-fold pyridoxal phosphate-dependent enzyme [Acidimicrobiales bacterium]|nr:aminotransferase class I/II-fold pyridoxal phosphate-dependent enzyme [Acidimicrobiales bacterium]
MSHALLVARSFDFATRLIDRGVRPSEPVLVAAGEPEPVITAYLGTVLAGGLPVIHPIRRAFDKRALIVGSIETAMRALGPHGHLVMEAGDSLMDDLHVTAPVVQFDLAVLEAIKSPPTCLTNASQRDMALHLQGTSGTTGTSKLAVITHGNAIANCLGLAARMQMTERDVTVSWLPLYHDMGLIMSVVLPLVTGSDAVLLSPFDFLTDPATYLRLISTDGGTISTMPNFGYELATRRSRPDRLDGVDLSAWRQANCGAEPIDVRVMERFVDRFASYGFSREAIKPGYGLAESTLAVTLTGAGEPAHYVRTRISSVASLATVEVSDMASFVDPLPPGGPDETDVISVGSVLRGLDFWLVDEHDRIIEDDDVCGEIKVAGTSVSPGYWRSDGPLDAITQSGLRTGDIGFTHKGELFVVERIKNIIIRHGENHSALLLEREIADALDRPRNETLVIDSDVRPGLGRVTAILGVDQKDDLAALEAGVREAQDGLPLALEDLVFVPRGALPRTTSGKKQHAKIRSMLAEGSITTFARVALTPMPPEPQNVVLDLVAIDAVGTTRDIVARMARRHGMTSAIDDTMHLAHDLGFDSLARLELAATIEEKTGLGITEVRLGAIQAVGDLLRTVEELQDLPAGEGGQMSVTALITHLTNQIPQTNLVVERQVGRRLLVDGRWITDFGSLNYLGLDLNPDVIASVDPMLKKWGTHPSWTRAVASPAPYVQLEHELAQLVGAPEVLVFPTITLLHLGVLPLLAGSEGTILVDDGSHKSMREAAELATARGARIVTVRRNDVDDLERQLRRCDPHSPRIITLNGVYSMPGTLPDIPGYAELARRYDATLYVDDAHGIGVLGEHPGPSMPYGSGGGGVVRYFGLDYDNIVYVAGLSKAFSSLGAFVTCRSPAERSLFLTASTMIFSGPIPVASLATALAGLRVNREEGDRLRRHVHRLTMRIIRGAHDAGLVVENEIGFPALTVVIGAVEQVVEACEVAWEHGILFTPAVFPAMPLERGGLRLSVTAANTDEDVDRVLDALEDIAARVMTRAALSVRG